VRAETRLLLGKTYLWGCTRYYTDNGLQAGDEAQRMPGLQVMVQEAEVTEVEIDGRFFRVCPVTPDVLQSANVVATALAVSLDKPFPAVFAIQGTGNTANGCASETWPLQP